MNIVIFGGGEPGKLGNTLGLKAQANGHKVLIISHKSHSENTLDTIVTEFNIDAVAESFEQAISQLGHVDLVLYCSRHVPGQITTETFDSGVIPVDDYYQTLLVDVLIPQKLMMLAHQKKMKTHFVFFTTWLSFNLVHDNDCKHSTYIGGKAWQRHLMRAVGCMDTTITATTFSVHFDWSEDNTRKIDYLYDFITLYQKNTATVIVHKVGFAQLLDGYHINDLAPLIKIKRS